MHLEKHGYKPLKSKLTFKRRFPRGFQDFGDTYGLDIEFDSDDQGGEFQLSQPFCGGGVDAIAEIMSKCFPELPYEQINRAQSFELRPIRLPFDAPPPGVEFAPHARYPTYLIRSLQGIDAAVDHYYHCHLVVKIFPVLEQCRTVEGLDKIMNAKGSGSFVLPFVETYTGETPQLIAAYLARNPQLEALMCDYEQRKKESYAYLDTGKPGGNHTVQYTRRCIAYLRQNPL